MLPYAATAAEVGCGCNTDKDCIIVIDNCEIQASRGLKECLDIFREKFKNGGSFCETSAESRLGGFKAKCKKHECVAIENKNKVKPPFMNLSQP